MDGYIGVLLVLCVVIILVSRRIDKSGTPIKNDAFERLQKNYLLVYYLATFSDWLQGPYLYKLYQDYGYGEHDVAVLYVVGFMSSSFFGLIIGHVADKYGRKLVCASYGVIYSLCCLAKTSSDFRILLLGRLFGGISTSILFSTFEAWYVNEHLNHHRLPPDWLNVTFGKMGFFTGVLAIVSGMLSQVMVESCGFGTVSPFLISIPFLLLSSYLVVTMWTEHKIEQKHISIASTLKLICVKERILLILCIIQSCFESVMYIFIFSWTPILSDINPPLGLVFSIFMLAFMIGTKIHSMLVSKHFLVEYILVYTCVLAFISISFVTLLISINLYDCVVPIYICLVAFIVFEISIGMYFPSIGYLRSRTVPEAFRASVTNCFRVPVNTITCFGLIFKQVGNPGFERYTFPAIFMGSSSLLFVTILFALLFAGLFTSKFSNADFSEDKIKVDNENDDMSSNGNKI